MPFQLADSEIRETVREIKIPLHIPVESAAAPAPKRPLSHLTAADPLSYGELAECTPDVRTADDDMLLVIATERHLLYVACTRARDHLLISSGVICSEFVEDLFPGQIK
jgi:hypothetical protein